MIHLDTSFLVDLLREARRGESGPATARLGELAEEPLGISFFVLCELEAGIAGAARPDDERRRVERIVATFEVDSPGLEVARRYGALLTELDRQGESVAAMDLLIAASALTAGAPLVTRNRKHFDRVPGLRVVGY